MTTVTMAKVRDLNATTEPRTHDLVDADGVKAAYAFPPGAWVDVPLTIATRWLVGNSGFEVKGPDGQVLKLVAQPQEAAGGRGLVLRPDQVVASLDELTIDALMSRVQARGGKLTKADGKQKMVAFLLSGGAAAAGAIDDAPAGEALGELVKAA
jgi:hypothetical protein